MAKKQQQQVTGQAQQNIGQTAQQTQADVSDIKSQQTPYTAAVPGLMSSATSAAGDIASSGGYTPEGLATARGSAATTAATGGYAPEDISFLRSIGAGNLETGGYDPTQVASLRAGYGSLATTGGISPEQEVAMKNEATRSVRGVYDVAQQNLNRKAAVTGGLGGQGEALALARGTGQAESEAVTKANADIAALKQKGIIAGLGGETTLEGGIAGGKTAAAADYGRTQAGVTEAQASGRVAGSAQQQGVESGVAAGRTTGSAQLGGLYANTAENAIQLGNQIVDRIKAGYQMTAQDEAIMADIANKQKGVWDNLLSGAGAAAGVLSAVIKPKP